MSFLLEEAEYIVAQAIIVTKPTSKAEIPPTRKIQGDIVRDGIFDKKTGEASKVRKTVIVGLGG